MKTFDERVLDPALVDDFNRVQSLNQNNSLKHQIESQSPTMKEFLPPSERVNPNQPLQLEVVSGTLNNPVFT